MADARDTLELFGVEVQEPRPAAAGSARPASADRARRHPSRNTRSLCVNPHFSIDPPPRLEDPECRTRDLHGGLRECVPNWNNGELGDFQMASKVEGVVDGGMRAEHA